MNQSDLIFISEALLASAFYYGVAGGITGAAVYSFLAAIYRKIRGG